MLSAIAAVILADPAFAQGSINPQIAAGCGPESTHFDVSVNSATQPLPGPAEGKALLVVFEVEKTDAVALKLGAVTTRVGLDGKWIGANHGDSYLAVPVDPGEHRVCGSWQSSQKRLSKLGSAASFEATAGKTYYFRLIVDERTNHKPSLRMEPVDPAEANFLLSSSRPVPRGQKPGRAGRLWVVAVRATFFAGEVFHSCADL